MTVGIKVDLAAGIVTGDAVNFGTDTLRSVEGINGTLLDDIYDATGFGANSVNVMSREIGVNEFEGGAGNDIIIGNGSTRISYVRSTSGVTVDMSGNNNGGFTVVGDISVGTDTIVGGVSSVVARPSPIPSPVTTTRLARCKSSTVAAAPTSSMARAASTASSTIRITRSRTASR